MIDLAILGLLDEQDLHGYELKKQLAELVGARSGVSFGSLYPALARLEKGGAVKAVEAHTADALFERRRTVLEQRLADRSRATAGRTDAYRSSLREHDTRTITHDLAWIDELIGAARAELAASGGSETHLNGGTTP